MNIRQVSYGVVGGLLMAGSLMSCDNEEYKDKAKSQAVEYLDGYELLRAERNEQRQNFTDKYSGAEVAYWDSLLIDAKSKEAYIKGQQMIRDSAEGKFFRKEKFNANLDTVLEGNLIDNLKKEYSKYTDAKTLIQARDSAPKMDVRNNEYAYHTHYWNLITLAGKQQKAYNQGAADERAIINQSNADSGK